jgi:hypothetical protein
MTGNWRDRFEPRATPIPGNRPAYGTEPPPNPTPDRHEAPIVDPFSGEGALSPARPQSAPPDDDGLALDMSVYRPWILQRGRCRPAMMLDLRRYEPKSGLWTGWAVSYPHLIAVEYTGDRILSLDFGARQFLIEGYGLFELASRIQEGVALGVYEYSAIIWPNCALGPVVTAIMPLKEA